MDGQETSWSQLLLLIAFRKQQVCFKYNMNVLFAGRSDTLCMQTALQSYYLLNNYYVSSPNGL